MLGCVAAKLGTVISRIKYSSVTTYTILFCNFDSAVGTALYLM